MTDKDKILSDNGQTKSQENGDVLDLDLEDAETIIKVPSSSFSGRKKYTLNEDIRILTFIATNYQSTNVTGTILWDVMERANVTDHSWQSMKCRYLRYILPDIDSYDIPNSWKSLLTGDTSKACHKKNSPSTMLKTYNNQSPKKKENSNFGLFGNRPPQMKKKRLSIVENVIETTSSSSQTQLSDPNCSAITSSTITPSPRKSPLTNTTSTPKHKDACSKFVNIAVNLEEQIEEYDSLEMSEDILVPNKSDNVSKLGSFSSGSEDEFDINLMRMTTENKSKDLVTDEKNQMNCFNASESDPKTSLDEVDVENNSVTANNKDSAVINVLSQSDQMIPSEDILVPNNSVSVIQTCSFTSGLEDEFDVNLMKMTVENKKKSFNASGQKTSSVEVDNNSVIVNNDSDVIKVLSQSDQTIQSESSLIDQKNRVEISDEICGDDEFDQNLIEKATAGIRSPCSGKLSSKRQTKSPVKRTSKRLNKGLSLRDFVACDDSELSTDETEESNIGELNKVVEEFQNKYDISKAQIISVLWSFSGNVKDAMQWIEFGSDLSNLQPWSKGDDSLLTSTTERDLDYLKAKHTAEKIAERHLFFEQFKL